LSDNSETASAATDKPARKQADKAAPKMTPEDWARATGNTRRALRRFVQPGQEMRFEKFSASHMAAAVMHGWSSHAEHYTEPHLIGKADYEAALAAVDGDKPHSGACSPALAVRAARAASVELKQKNTRKARANRRAVARKGR
jgi:hypothetical protein